MDTYELRAALTTLYREWEQATLPAFYSYQASIGKRKAVLYAAAQSYLPRLQVLENQITEWADETKARGHEEAKMRYRAGRIRAAIVNTDPNDVAVRQAV